MTKKLVALMAGIFILVFLLDIIVFGESAITDSALKGLSSYFIPLWATLWFTELVSFIVIAAVVIVLHKAIRLLPLVTLGLASLLICILIVGQKPHIAVTDRYNNPVGRIYRTLHNTVPHGLSSFVGLPMTDWSLESAFPVLLLLQIPFIPALVAGVGLKYFIFKLGWVAKSKRKIIPA